MYGKIGLVKIVQFFALAAAFFAPGACFSAPPDKPSIIIFAAEDPLAPSNAAVLRGIKDALREMELRYGGKFEARIENLGSGAEEQSRRLGSFCVDGYSAAIVRSSEAEKISGEIGRLKGLNFPVALVEKDSEGDRIFFAGTDFKKTLDILKKSISELEKSGTQILCFFKGEGVHSIPANSEKLKEALSPNFTPKEFGELFSRPPAEIISANFYSDYVDLNRGKISMYDNYALLFFNPDVISNIRPFPKDPDRNFSICVGALPQLCEYLASGDLSLCVYDDYYGWGYVSARAIAEKLRDPKNFKPGKVLLPPLEATPKNEKSYKKDWKNWLR